MSAPKTFLSEDGYQVIELGFSGSRKGWSEHQRAFIKRALMGKMGRAHHGDCVGSDTDLHKLLRTEFPGRWKIIGHPPLKDVWRAHNVFDEIFDPRPYTVRNGHIIQNCNVFFATPSSMDQKGGTWNTIKQFRNLLEMEYGKPNMNPRQGFIILPNGTYGEIKVSRKSSIDLSNIS